MPTDCDYVSNQNPAIFVHLAEKGLIPDYVMKSARVTTAEVEKLSSTAFAEPLTRLYPCHTKEACWQSAAYYAGTNGTDDDTYDSIIKMAAHHGILDDVESVFDAFAEELKKAAALNETVEPEMEKFALTVNYEGYDGRGIENYYPIGNVADVMDSAEAAVSDFNRSRLPLDVLRKVACEIVSAANQLNIDEQELPGTIRQFGIQRLPDPYAAQALVLMRKAANVNMEPYFEILDELCANFEKAASVWEAVELSDHAASKMTLLDIDNNIRYSPTMSNPFDILFTGPRMSEFEKAAAQNVTIQNVHIPVTDFLNLSDSQIETLFSKATGEVIKSAKADVMGEESMEKTATAESKISALPKDVQQVLLQTLASTAW